MISKSEFLKIATKQDGNSFDNSERHIRKIEQTEEYLLFNGQTEYQILLSPSPTAREQKAAEELCDLFEEGTGVRLSIVLDDNKDFAFDKKYLSIGNTKLVKEAKIECTYEELTQQGFFIKSYKKSILFVGWSDFGSLYAVYDFLEGILHFDYFNPETYSIDKDVKEIPLFRYDVKEVPDIGAFSKNYGSLLTGYGAKNVLERYRMSEREDTIMSVDGYVSVHNMLMFLPHEKNVEAHPLWYTNFRETVENFAFEESLCLTAHGNKEEYNSLVEAFVERIKEQFRRGAKGNVMFFGQSDGSPACDCPACKENKEKYGSDNGYVYRQSIRIYLLRHERRGLF